jgi:hypothetical protein
MQIASILAPGAESEHAKSEFSQNGAECVQFRDILANDAGICSAHGGALIQVI